MLRHLLESIKTIAAGFGGPGLLLLTFLDSSFLSFPEVPDFLLIWFVAREPAWWIYYAAMATIGSTAGCYALYAVARRGGDTFVHRRLNKRGNIERSLATVRKYGLLTVIVPSLLPPPAPFKLFVVLAGLADIKPGPFTLAVIIGRGFRYGLEALFAYHYGEPALNFVNENIATISIWLAVAVAVIGGATVVWRRMRKK
jgi:membrane protein YqaA with SNARE-associated domain